MNGSPGAGKPPNLERLLMVAGHLMYVTSNNDMLTEVIFKALASGALNLQENRKNLFHFI